MIPDHPTTNLVRLATGCGLVLGGAEAPAALGTHSCGEAGGECGEAVGKCGEARGKCGDQ